MEEISLTKKKILYIGPSSIHYDQSVMNKLIELGAEVTFADILNLYPYTFYLKALNKLNLYYKDVHHASFYNKILAKRDYDYILVRHGYQLDITFLERLRKNNPNAKLINFHWDAIRPDYNYLHIIKYFDKICSFDVRDCQNYKTLNYLPLFYLDVYEEFKINNINNLIEVKNDLLFVGSWRNLERYNYIKLTQKICEQNRLRFSYYLNYSYKEQFDSLIKGIMPKEAKNKMLSHKEVLNLFASSNTIIDFPSSFQTGLTMRTFETLGAGKKLITTNKNILNEPFYDPDYINVIDINKFNINFEFVKSMPTNSITDKIKDYSIKNYIIKLLQ